MHGEEDCIESEDAVGKAVVDRHSRESFTIATKMPDMMLKNAEHVPEIFERQKEKLHTDYFDYYLVHDMNNVNVKKAEKFGVIDFVREKRQTVEIPCSGCRYCVEANTCPKDILIPNYIALYNTLKLMYREDFSTEVEYYDNYIAQGYGRASDCIACHQCGKVCPQHIKISQWMPKIAADLEQE